MHKNGKWAKKILALQDEEGKWGWFHTLSQLCDSPITTEQALRRLERLGYTIEDPCIQKTVHYMNDCLLGKNEIPDIKEKLHDWNIFTSLMLSTWIRRFTPDNSNANQVAGQWAEIISAAFGNGTYDHQMYVRAYTDSFGLKPKGGRLIDFVSFYQISILRDCLNENTEKAVLDYVLHKDDGIYYIYSNRLSDLPQSFKSKEGSRYLAAIELLSEYKYAKHKLGYVAEWLKENQNENGKWDMGKAVNDKIYFPLSDDWRKQETRENDCTERIMNLMQRLQ